MLSIERPDPEPVDYYDHQSFQKWDSTPEEELEPICEYVESWLVDHELECALAGTAIIGPDAWWHRCEAWRSARCRMSEYEPGVTKIQEGRCPIHAGSPMACMFCQFGHMTECHHPATCEEAECSHYQRDLEAELGTP